MGIYLLNMNVPKRVLDDENLETPQQSVKFLEYYQKHVDKTERARDRLHSFSKVCMVAAAGALGYMAYSYLSSPAQAPRRTETGRPHLGAANAAEEPDQMAGMFSGVSVFIWGLVLTKARQGMEAAGTKDSGSVGGLLKKSAGLIFMIAVASVFQLMSTYSSAMTPAIQEVAHHALQSSHTQPRAASFYDETSSHYMGGAHNVALANLSKRLQTKPTVQMEQAGFLATLSASISAREPMSQQEYEQNLRTTGAFLAFIATGAACIAFYVHFRAYHLALEKLDSLTTLFHNPNARVASGDQGKRILKRLGVSSEEEQQQEKRTQLNDTAQQVAMLLQAAKGGNTLLQAAANYRPPAIVEETPAANTVSSYQLPNAPQLSQPLLTAAHQPYVHPGSFQ